MKTNFPQQTSGIRDDTRSQPMNEAAWSAFRDAFKTCRKIPVSGFIRSTFTSTPFTREVHLSRFASQLPGCYISRCFREGSVSVIRHPQYHQARAPPATHRVFKVETVVCYARVVTMAAEAICVLVEVLNMCLTLKVILNVSHRPRHQE